MMFVLLRCLGTTGYSKILHIDQRAFGSAMVTLLQSANHTTSSMYVFPSALNFPLPFPPCSLIFQGPVCCAS